MERTEAQAPAPMSTSPTQLKAGVIVNWNLAASRQIPSPFLSLLDVVGICTTSPAAYAYSQPTHEELVDLLWADSICPLLMQRYPKTTGRELVRAHAFAYGGSLIQDIGYYPFGKLF